MRKTSSLKDDDDEEELYGNKIKKISNKEARFLMAANCIANVA
jgi:hypothetical protein